jgi:hypothetical protein
MAKDNQINVRVNDRTNEAIENFAEDKDYIKTEAVRRMVEGRLAGEGYLEGVAVSDGGTLIEDRLEAVEQRQQTIKNNQEQTATEIENLFKYLRTLSKPLLAALLWFGVTSAVSIPGTIPEVATGVLLVIWLGYATYKLEP